MDWTAIMLQHPGYDTV